MTVNWQGCVLSIGIGGVQGWLRMAGVQYPVVELCYKGEVLSSGVSNYYSKLLADAGIGDGHHAFILPVPSSVASSEYDALRVRIQATAQELPWHAILEDVSTTTIGNSGLDGHLDSIDGLVIRGWAWNARHPGDPVMLDVVIDGVLEGRIECGDYRQDLMLLGKGNGFHGFKAALPLHVLDGKPHALSLRFSNSEQVLHGCPLPIRLPALQAAHLLQHASDVLAGAQEKAGGVLESVRRLCPPPAISAADNDEARRYAQWIAKHDTLSPSDLHAISQHIMRMKEPPVISVLMPTYNTPETYLRAAIESVLGQLYPYFELCIADDASTHAHVREVLEEYAARDARIRLTLRSANGHISEATNSALKLATGAYVGLFDHDDLLAPHALYMMADAIRESGAQLLYCDEDKIDESGVRFMPHFKPQWNPLYLYACNYVTHFTVVRRTLLLEAGGPLTRYNGSQDHELLLRLARRIAPEHVRHVPFVLYHWRASSESTAMHAEAKSYAVSARLAAVTQHARAVDKKAEVRLTPWGSCDVKWSIKGNPKVSIIIPTRDNAAMLALCVASIREKTDYTNYEILIVDNGSVEPATAQLFAEFARHPEIRILRYDAPFNYSAINNFAVRHAKGTLLCLMNNDVEAVSADWLSRMIGILQKHRAGAVGAKLLYPSGTIQHGGIVMGMGGVAGHYHRETAASAPGYMFRAISDQALSGVTAACLLTPKSCYAEVGGLDEKELPVAFNDVDYCLKLRARGYGVYYSANSVLVHHESVSRGKEDTPAKKFRAHGEILVMQKRWGDALADDPYFNPNLSLACDNLHALADAPRARKPWRCTDMHVPHAEKPKDETAREELELQ